MKIAKKYALLFALLALCISAKSTASDYSGNSIVEMTEPDIEFIRLAERHNIPTRTLVGFKDIFNGYYLIAGVFGQSNNAKSFAKQFGAKGLNVKIIEDPKKRLNYVSLSYHRTGVKAIESVLSDIENKYHDPLWILHIDKSKPPRVTRREVSNSKPNISPTFSEFKVAAKRNNIANREMSDLAGVKNGYYVIAGVYGERKNAEKHIFRLKTRSLSSKIMRNSKNGLHYVYLTHNTDWKKAIKACSNKMDGRYSDKLWILAVVSGDAKVSSELKKTVDNSNKQESDKRLFYALTAEKNIPTRSDPGFTGLNRGFYLISGVFGDTKNANAYLRKILSKQPQAKLVKHPKSNLNYVYLRHYEFGKDAITAYLSGLNGSYKDAMWILHIDPPDEMSKGQSGTDNGEEIISNKNLKANVDGYLPSLLQKAKKDPVFNDKLLEKADSYFDKMWYAEAAELYEMVLNENPENQTFDIIRKAGDAHYFNTNMERAFHWYDLLYNKYKSDMKSDNLFKYAHTLKGTGKYGRAKRLMRLYNKALKEEGPKRTYRPRPNESNLDNILSTEGEYNIKNIAVNSEYSDFSPMFYQGNKMVYASAMDSAFFNTRRYKWNNQPYLDLYVAKINEESDEVRNAVKFSREINTKYHEAAVTFSPDQQTIYFTRNNYGKKLKRDKKGINHLKIYMSRKTGDTWSEAIELPFNSDSYSTGHPALSPDGKKLYFVSDMPGSIGETDLFVVDVLGDGQFSEPRNLGPEINTERKEMFPFISDEKLYFSSDGHVGLGGLDIYEAALSEEGFAEVINMGKPINSRRDDFSYIVNEETHKGFFASNRRGGKGDDDIYSFKKILPEEPNENAIAGVVTEMVSGDVMPKSLVVLMDENNMKLKEMETEEDGSFVFEELESNTRYVIRTVRDNYQQDEQMVSTLDNERIDVDVKLRRLEERIVLEDGIRKLKTDMIYFDFDKFNIRTDAAEELNKLVEVMNNYPSMIIRIESHTDSRGKRAYNKYLSDKRAKSTRDYLISKGIDPKRIESAVGYGEEKLLNECNGSVRCSSAKHQLNRRSEFIIVSM